MGNRMRKFFSFMTRRDEFGDSPLSLAVCAAVFLLAITALFNMPGY